MRIIYLFAILLFSTAQTALAADWLSHYYEHPTPERFVSEVQAMSKAGSLSNPNTASAISVFLGRVMAANPTQIDAWLAELEGLKGVDRQTVLMAASLSATKEAQTYIDRQPDAEKYRAKPIDIRALEPKHPTVLDMLWADFFATGDALPVRRIVVALNYDKYSGALERYAKSEKTAQDRNEAILDAVFKAAMWSLESNTQQHPRVGQILDQIYFSGKLTQPEQVWLAAILAKAMPEQYELTHPADGKMNFKRKVPVQNNSGWRDSNGKPASETNSMKSIDGFGGLLLATTDDDWEKKWNTPPETKPKFTAAGRVPYGKTIYILTFFANPKVDPQGNAEVRCDLRLLDPAGHVALQQKDTDCYSGALQGSPYAQRLSAPVLAFSGEPGDPEGTWLIEVILRDTVRQVELPLRTSFELTRT